MTQDKSTPRPWTDEAVEKVATIINPDAFNRTEIVGGTAQDQHVFRSMQSQFREEAREKARAAIATISAVHSHDAVRKALADYDAALARREHGGVAAGHCVDALRSALAGRGVETGSAIEAPREMSGLSEAMQECVEALRKIAECRDVYSMRGIAESALAKLEKAT